MKRLLLPLIALMLSQAEMAAQVLQAEILIFSGRPNPTFIISDPAEIREILGAAAALPQKSALGAGDEAAEKSSLGYRGIVVTNLSATAPEVKSMVVSRTAVQITRTPAAAKPGNRTATSAAIGATIERRTDRSSALENRLLQTALKQKAIDPGLLAAITSQRGPD